ncbi:MAG: aminomethyl-transferring glycine dehydrogenase subunit GcvPA [Candidatus Hodarchaeales archaeon]
MAPLEENSMDTPFIPHTNDDVREMLEYLQLKGLDDLFSDVPKDLFVKGEQGRLPRTHGEMEAQQFFNKMMGKNITTNDYLSFLGGGIYNRFIPSTVGSITGRSEFYSSYTPYAPEISQGMLQTLFEYQSLVCELAGMEISNTSMYDSTTAVAEALLLMSRVNKKKTVVIPGILHPDKKSTLETMLIPKGVEIIEIEHDKKTGLLNRSALREVIEKPEVSGIYFEQPNYLGLFENDPREICNQAKANDKLVCIGFDPVSIALVESPGSYGADIAVAEGQGIGLSQNFGGPLLGILTARNSKKLIRQMPGRIIGASKTLKDGKDAYVMTLQTREQHIRREKATSNICSNEALTSVATTVYLATMGPAGLKAVAENLMAKSNYLAEKIDEIPGFKVPYISQAFMQEFPVFLEKEGDSFADLQAFMQEEGIFPGISLAGVYPGSERLFLICVSEKHSIEDLNRFTRLLRSYTER